MQFLNRKLSAGFVKIVGNTGWMFGERFIRLLLNTYINIWMARSLGPLLFGQMNYVFSLVAFFGVFAGLGLEQIVIRELVNKPGERNSILGSAFLLRLVSGVFSMLLCAATVMTVRAGESEIIVYTLIMSSTLLMQSTDIVEYYFRSQIQSKYAALSRTIPAIIIAAVKIYLLFVKAPLLLIFVAYAAEIGLSGIWLLFSFRYKKLGIRNWKATWPRTTALLVQSWPLIMTGAAITVYMKVDQIILSAFISDKEVGVYAASLKITEIYYILPVVLSSSISPLLIDAFRSGQEKYKLQTGRLFNVMTLLGLFCCIPVSIFSSQIIALVFGAKYFGAGEILRYHIWTGFFVGWGLLKDTCLIAEEKQKISLITTVVGAGFSLGLNFLFIPWFGGVGAALSMIISQAVSATLTVAAFKDARHISRMQIRSLLHFYNFKS